MKKKVLLLVLVLCLSLALVMTAFACGNLGGDDSEDEGSNDAEGSSFEYQASAVAAKLETMRQNTGYLVSYRATGTQVDESEARSTVSIGAKGNIYYVASDDSMYYFDFGNDAYSVEYHKSGSGDWQKTVTYYNETYTQELVQSTSKALIQGYSGWMTYYDNYSSTMDGATKSTVTIAGRTCDQFTVSASAVTIGTGAVSASYSCAVDKQTSICLKWYYETKANGQTESWGLECTEFNANPTFTLPTVSAANTETIGAPSANQGNNGSEGSNTGSETGNQQSGNNGSENGNEQGGNNGSGTAAVQTKTMPSAQSIISAIGSTYKVSATNSYGSVGTSASNGTYYYYTNPSKVFQQKIGDYYYSYTDLRDGKYHNMTSPRYYPEESLGTPLGIGLVREIFQFAGKTISYQSETTTTFLGRAAKKYTYQAASANGYDRGFTFEAIFDDQTGACLKCTSEGMAGDGFNGGEQPISFEITEFEFGTNNAAALALINGEAAMIDVYPWDTAYMTQVGLGRVAPLDETGLWSSYWDYDSSRDSDAPYWEVQYRLKSNTLAARENEMTAICRAFYDAGAKLNWDGDAEEAFESIYWNDGEGSISFTGYTADYMIQLYCDYQSYATTPYWQVTVTINLKY